MDNTKDITINQDNGSDSKNHSNDFYLYGNSDSYMVSKKTEKLASALYLITSLLSDNEPMKWTLRKKVSELLSFVSSYKNIRQVELLIFNTSLKNRISELVSLLEVSYSGGLISEMNFNIVKSEFLKLLDISSNVNEKTDVTNSFISNDYFDKQTGSNFPVFNQISSSNQSANLIKDKISIKDSSVFRSNNRQSIIIGLLKKKKDLTIKDVSSIIKDVSEKTIQRELISLIEAGIVTKTGERRWSKYSLVNNNS